MNEKISSNINVTIQWPLALKKTMKTVFFCRAKYLLSRRKNILTLRRTYYIIMPVTNCCYQTYNSFTIRHESPWICNVQNGRFLPRNYTYNLQLALEIDNYYRVWYSMTKRLDLVLSEKPCCSCFLLVISACNALLPSRSCLLGSRKNLSHIET